MAYADFLKEDIYVSKLSGSHVSILLFDSTNPTAPVIGAASGINWSGELEVIVVEEAGEDGANEIVQGRHSLAGTVSAFFTPQRNDVLPTRQTFIGKEYTILEQIAEGRQGAGTPINVIVGARLSRVASSHGARGLKTSEMAFTAKRRYNGKQWAAKSGGS